MPCSINQYLPSFRADRSGIGFLREGYYNSLFCMHRLVSKEHQAYLQSLVSRIRCGMLFSMCCPHLFNILFVRAAFPFIFMYFAGVPPSYANTEMPRICRWAFRLWHFHYLSQGNNNVRQGNNVVRRQRAPDAEAKCSEIDGKILHKTFSRRRVLILFTINNTLGNMCSCIEARTLV